MSLKISNRAARRLWLAAHGLGTSPTGPLDVAGIIKSLGFVQLDTIRNVVRAHHHIIWSRNNKYRPEMLAPLLTGRQVFEHFTHDASILPIETYPFWQRQFQRIEGQIRASRSFSSMPDAKERKKIKARIAREGPLCTKAFDTKIIGKKEMWARPPHKRALDFMWYAGELSTSHRVNFRKFYDLTERVIPARFREQENADDAQINWLCHQALNRLCFATPKDIQHFWAALNRAEVEGWLAHARDLVHVKISTSDGTVCPAIALPDIEQRQLACAAPTPRLRLINPFDPAIRDRVRLKRLFGFAYKNEIFIPAAKRQWGYYVYPLLEGDRFVGRIEIRAERKTGEMIIANFWPETGVSWNMGRTARLAAELARFCRFAGLERTRWACKAPDKRA